jgi:hypothetical protein
MYNKCTHYVLTALTIGALATPLIATNSPKAAAPSNSIEQPATSNKKGANTGAADTTTNAAAKPVHLNRKEILTHIEALAKNLSYVPDSITKKLHKTVDEGEKVSDEALTELVSSVLKLARPKPADSQEATEHYKALKTAEGLLIKRLKSYRITGFSLSIDPNGAFIWDNQNPAFTVAYCNAKGETKSRTYQASIDSIGLKFEFAVKLDLIFFTGTDADFYSTNKVIELGTGIEVNGGLFLQFLLRHQPSVYENFIARVHDSARPIQAIAPPTPQETLIRRTLGNMSLLYVPFRNVSGGLLIFGFAVGPLLFDGSCSDFYYGDISIVYGGTLTPVD